VTTRRQTKTLVRPFFEMMWLGPTTYKTMASGKLLWAIGFNHLMREKQKNQATTRRQTGTLVRFLCEVMWPDTTK